MTLVNDISHYFGRVSTLHVDHVEKILCESYIVEFDPTCNYYERGKYGCRNFHVTRLPLIRLRLLLFLSAFLHMLVFAFLDNLVC